MTPLLAFDMTEGMFTVLIVQVCTVLLFILKDRADRNARKEEREERAALAALTHKGLDEVKQAGGEREERIIASVKMVEAKAETIEAKADAAYKEANNVNLKMESLGIQTKPMRVEVINDPEHPVPTTQTP